MYVTFRVWDGVRFGFSLSWNILVGPILSVLWKILHICMRSPWHFLFCHFGSVPLFMTWVGLKVCKCLLKLVNIQVKGIYTLISMNNPKTLNNQAPNYLTDILKFYNASNSTDDSRRWLRSSSDATSHTLFEASSWGKFLPGVCSAA